MITAVAAGLSLLGRTRLGGISHHRNQRHGGSVRGNLAERLSDLTAVEPESNNRVRASTHGHLDHPSDRILPRIRQHHDIAIHGVSAAQVGSQLTGTRDNADHVANYPRDIATRNGLHGDDRQSTRDHSGLLESRRLRCPLARLLSVRALLPGLTVRLLWWVLSGLLTVRALLAWIGLLRLPSGRRLSVRLLRWILSGLLLPVRIGLILSVGRLLPVVAHE